MKNADSHTIGFWHTNHRLATLSDNEKVGIARGKSVAGGVSNLYNVEATWVTFTVGQRTDTTSIAPFSAHNKVSKFVLNEVGDFVGVDVNFNGVANLNKRVGVANGTRVVGHDVWYFLLGNGDLLDAAEFVSGFLLRQWLENESTFGIVQ